METLLFFSSAAHFLFDPRTVVSTYSLSIALHHTETQHVVLCLVLHSSLETSVKRKIRGKKTYSVPSFKLVTLLMVLTSMKRCSVLGKLSFFQENVQHLLPFFHSFCKVDKHLEFNMPLMDSSLRCK